MKGVEGAAQVRNVGQVVNIQQINNFQYQVQKPRREPYSLECVKAEYQRTFSSVLFEAYVLNKAREITREFSYRDFLELKHDAFRRIVLRLKQKGKVIANPQTNPPPILLPNRKNRRGDARMENTTVKQMFTTKSLRAFWRVWSSLGVCRFCCVAQLRFCMNFGGFRV